MKTLLPLLLLLLPACVDYRFGSRREPGELDVPGCLSLEPTELDFEVLTGQSDEGLVEVSNPCSGWLEVYSVELSRGDGPVSLGPLTDPLIEPEGHSDVTVRFAPEKPGLWEEHLILTTDDPEAEEVHIPITAESVDPER